MSIGPFRHEDFAVPLITPLATPEAGEATKVSHGKIGQNNPVAYSECLTEFFSSIPQGSIVLSPFHTVKDDAIKWQFADAAIQNAIIFLQKHPKDKSSIKIAYETPEELRILQAAVVKARGNPDDFVFIQKPIQQVSANFAFIQEVSEKPEIPETEKKPRRWFQLKRREPEMHTLEGAKGDINARRARLVEQVVLQKGLQKSEAFAPFANMRKKLTPEEYQKHLLKCADTILSKYKDCTSNDGKAIDLKKLKQVLSNDKSMSKSQKKLLIKTAEEFNKVLPEYVTLTRQSRGEKIVMGRLTRQTPRGTRK